MENVLPMRQDIALCAAHFGAVSRLLDVVGRWTGQYPESSALRWGQREMRTGRLILSATEVGRFMLPLCSSLGWAFRCCGSTRIHPIVEA